MVTSLKLLIAATDLVCELGFAGLRIDEIASRAGVNKRMIYAHYGGRAGLEAAVFANALWSLMQRDDCDDTLREFARQLLQIIERADTRLPLLSRRLVDGDARIALLGLMHARWGPEVLNIEMPIGEDVWQRLAAQWLQFALPDLHQKVVTSVVGERSLTPIDRKEKPRFTMRSTSVRR